MDSQKICVVCGADVAAAPRVKDPRGNYYCQGCYHAALAAKRAQEGKHVVPVAIGPRPGAAGRLPSAALAARSETAEADETPDLLDAAQELAAAPVDESEAYRPVAQPAPRPIPQTPRPVARGTPRPARSGSSSRGELISDAMAEKLVPLLILAGYGPTVALHVYNALSLGKPLLLLGGMLGLALLAFVMVPASLLGVRLVMRMFSREVREGAYMFLLAVWATPSAAVYIGRFAAGQQGAIIGLIAGLPLAFLVFCMLFRGGILIDLLSFIAAVILAFVTVICLGCVIAMVFGGLAGAMRGTGRF